MIALVTGGNRGLGFEACRQLGKKGFTVILTSRNKEKGEEATLKLKEEGLDIVFHQLDVSDEESVVAVKYFVEEKYNNLDVLLNNAGIMIDSREKSIFESDLDILKKTVEVNVYGVFLMCKHLIPLMNNGRVINVSSGLGQLSDMGSGFPGYRISKTAVNAITRMFSDESDCSVNSVCPGWVKTDMGGPHAEREPEKGVETMIWLATTDNPPTGKFFRDKKEIPW